MPFSLLATSPPVRAWSRLALWLTLLAWVWPGLASAGHGRMQPDQATLWQWEQERRTAPPARVAANGDAADRPRASASLLSFLTYVPAQRNQELCGNCWVWAGTSAAEIALARQRGITERLSEQYFDSCWTGAVQACCGGNLPALAAFYNDPSRFMVPWSNANAAFADQFDATCQPSAVACSSIGTSSRYAVTSAVARSLAIAGSSHEQVVADLKSLIDQGYAVYYVMLLPNSTAWNAFYSFWDFQAETDVFDPAAFKGQAWVDGQGAAHAMLIVGYDDSDASGPCWVVLNSWGAPSGRPNGLWRLPMQADYHAVMDMAGSDYPMFQFWDLDIVFSAVTPCGYAVSAPAAVPSAGGGQPLALNASAASCPWTASISENWLSLSASSGTGQAVLTLTAGPNTGQARTASLAIAGVPLTVSQNGVLPCPASQGRLRQTVIPQAAAAKHPGFCLSPDGRCFEFLDNSATACVAAADQTVSFAAIPGWETPADQALAVAAGQEAQVSASYVRSPQRIASLLTLGLPGAIAGGDAASGGFDERFVSAVTAWMPNAFGVWAGMGGHIVNSGVPAKTDGLLSYGPKTFSSLDYTVEMRRDGSPLASNYLFFRATPMPETATGGITSGYVFGYNNAGSFVVGKVMPATGWAALQEWTPSAAIRPGDWNALRAKASGGDLRFYINDVLVFAVADVAFASGFVGFGLYDGSGGALGVRAAALRTSDGPEAASAPVDRSRDRPVSAASERPQALP